MSAYTSQRNNWSAKNKYIFYFLWDFFLLKLKVAIVYMYMYAHIFYNGRFLCVGLV